MLGLGTASTIGGVLRMNKVENIDIEDAHTSKEEAERDLKDVESSLRQSEDQIAKCINQSNIQRAGQNPDSVRASVARISAKSF